MNRLELRNIRKSFSGVEVLHDVSIQVKRGEVHSLVGENGAGKSTLMRLVSGLIRPDHGELLVEGKAFSFSSSVDALNAGISMSSQELALVPELSVVDNVFLGRLGSAVRKVPIRQWRTRLQEWFKKSGFDLDPAALVKHLTPADRQAVEIIRAVERGRRLIILDEPTASLTIDGVDKLLAFIELIAQRQISIIFISHHLEEVLRCSDRITVLRDGEVVSSSLAAEEDAQSLVRKMVGRDLASLYPDRPFLPKEQATLLEIKDLTRRKRVKKCSLHINSGEIVGMAGLVGAGRSELARLIFGADHPDSGKIFINGKLVNVTSPSFAQKLGIGLLPESRKLDGLLLGRSVKENVSLSCLEKISKLNFVRTRLENRLVREIMKECQVKVSDIRQNVSTLSGGNQQKTMFSKWLLSDPKILIVDEPTRGVDIQSKKQIHFLLATLAEKGVGILLISSDLDEVIGMSHRLYVMRGGEIVAEHAKNKKNKEIIIAQAFGADMS